MESLWHYHWCTDTRLQQTGVTRRRRREGDSAMSGPGVCWEEVARSPLLARCHAASVTSGGRVYIHGGLASAEQRGPPLASLVCWDPASGAVTELDTSLPRSHHTASLLPGEV